MTSKPVSAAIFVLLVHVFSSSRRAYTQSFHRDPPVPNERVLRHKRKGIALIAERYRALTHAIRAPVRLVSSFHAFSWPLARHFAARYLCTVSICRHYHLDLPPNRHRFGGKYILIWRQIDIVTARCLCRSRMAPLRASRGRRNPPLPRLVVTYDSHLQFPQADFHLRRDENRLVILYSKRRSWILVLSREIAKHTIIGV